MFSAATQPRALGDKYSVTVDQVVGGALGGGRMSSLALGVQLQLRPLDGEIMGGRFAFATAAGAQIDAAAGALTRSCGGTFPSPPIDLQSSANYLQILDLQMNVAVIALACGVTPVATLQLTDSEAGNVPLPFLGAAKATWRQVARE